MDIWDLASHLTQDSQGPILGAIINKEVVKPKLASQLVFHQLTSCQKGSNSGLFIVTRDNNRQTFHEFPR